MQFQNHFFIATELAVNVCFSFKKIIHLLNLLTIQISLLLNLLLTFYMHIIALIYFVKLSAILTIQKPPKRLN